MSDNIPIKCRRCGICCLADINAFITKDDLKRWEKEGREDILHLLQHEHAVWAGDHFVSSYDGRYIHGCIFLTWEDHQYSCTIYGTRPKTCRDYMPGSSAICLQFKKVFVTLLPLLASLSSVLRAYEYLR
jgi:Fe-S-cluster containining protein